MPTLVTFNKPDGSPGYNSKTGGMYQIEFTEDTDRYTEEWIQGARECQRVLRCRWNNRDKFQKDMIGQMFRNPDGTLQRWLPEPHPDISGMYCTAMKLLRGMGRPSIDYTTTLCRFLDDVSPPTPEPDRPDQPTPRTPTYGLAEFLATYQRLPYFVAADNQVAQYGTIRESSRFTSRQVRTASESITLPATAFKWVDPDPIKQTPLPTGPIKVFYTEEIIFTWHKVPGTNRTSIRNCIGKVNKVTFDGRDPGTVLFLAPDVDIDAGTWTGIDTGGAPTDPFGNRYDQGVLFTHVYRFLYRQQGWNKFFRKTASGGRFQDFSIDGSTSTADGNRLIDEIDLYTLWNLQS